MDDATIAAHPQAPATALARIVSQRPDLRAIVAANPAAQPALLEWLAALHDPAVDAALASRSAQRVPVSSWAPEATPGAGWGPAAPAPATAFAQATYAGPATAVQDVTFQEEPRTRRRLWIGLVATAVVLVGGGALAAYLMVFSKLDGAPTPEAAVTQLVEGVAHKDGVAVYGSIAPSEVDGFGPLLSTSTGSADDEENRKKLLRVLDALDVDLTGLDVDVEPIGDGLAKVTFVGGTLSVDGDASEVVDALSDVYDPAMGGLEGLSGESTEQMWDEARAQVDEALPWSVDAADLTWQTKAGTQRPFLVAVHERGGWYVSPLMTLGEYVTVSSGGERGAMPTAAEQTGSATAEEAGSAFADAVTDLLGGDATALAAALPPAEARFVSVYVSRWVADAHWSASSATVDEATFVPERIDDTRTRLTIGRIEIGGDSPATIEGTCVTDGASGQKLCADDSAIGAQLGLDELGLVAVRGDAGWHVSVLATTADWSRIVGEHVKALQDSGELADGSWLQSLIMGGMVDGGMVDYGSDDYGSDDYGSDDYGSDESDAFDLGGYRFDDSGNLLDPNGVVVEDWTFGDDGSLVDGDGNVLWAAPSADY